MSELIQHELAQIITHELKDPRVGFITVTEVRATTDLKVARVFVSVYGDEAQRQLSLLGLNKASGYLKREIGQRLKLRHTPELEFVHDDSLDRADRLQELLVAISHGEQETPEAHPHPAVPVNTNRSALAERERDFAQAQKKKPKRAPRRRR